ncbi:protein-tyrosine phosphatase-like protein, partial [Baffinella frigidus]
YRPYCKDFGPIDLGTVVTICRDLRDLLANPLLRDRPVIYYCYRDAAEQTNAAFALASYMMLVEGRTPEEAWAPFAHVEPSPWIMFRDATNVASDFDIAPLDCLRGLARGREERFFSLDEMDVDAFRAMDDLGASSICPKFVAFKGPYAGPNKPSWAHEPAAYMEALGATGVTDVVRLNEASSYNAHEFTERGMAHHDLEFVDCSTPPLHIVTDFMRICNEAEGTVAVHCLAGLGRTGTLIGLWLMAHHHWAARETIGWLRLVRPGSVIGAQQHFLVAVQGAI